MEPTFDPNVFIVARRDGEIEYLRITDNVRWVIRGTCNQCGLCEIGNTPDREAVIVWQGTLGEPGAVFDLTYGERLDYPLMPEAPAAYGVGPTGGTCVLSGEYLNDN